MVFGYYLAATRTRHGDPHAARLARILWRLRGHRNPSRVDGVSVWTDDRGMHVRLIVRDLFGDACVRFPPAAPFAVPRIHTLTL